MKNNNGGFASIIAIVVVAVVMVLWVMAFFTKLYSIDNGNVWVLVYRAWQNQKWVSETPLTPGYWFRSLWTESVQEYPVYQQFVIWTSSNKEGWVDDTSMIAKSKEWMVINVNTALSFTLDPVKIPDLYVRFKTNIETIQNNFIKNEVRKALNDVMTQYSAEDIYSVKQTEITGKVQKLLEDRLGPVGIIIQQYTINEANPPKAVVDAINQKMVVSQNAGTAEQQLRVVKMQAEQAVAKAKWEAEARIAAATAEAEAIKIQAQAIESQWGWNYVKLKWVEAWQAGGSKVPTYVTSNDGQSFLFNQNNIEKSTN